MKGIYKYRKDLGTWKRSISKLGIDRRQSGTSKCAVEARR